MKKEIGYIVILKDRSKGTKALHTVTTRYGESNSMTDIEDATIYTKEQAEWKAYVYARQTKTIKEEDLEVRSATKIIDVQIGE